MRVERSYVGEGTTAILCSHEACKWNQFAGFVMFPLMGGEARHESAINRSSVFPVYSPSFMVNVNALIRSSTVKLSCLLLGLLAS